MASNIEKSICLTIDGYRKNVFEAVDYLKNYIINNESNLLSVNISKLNLIDATKISVLCSTFHFSKHPEGEIKWYVQDEETKKTIKLLKLKNVKIEIISTKQPNKTTSIKNISDCVCLQV